MTISYLKLKKIAFFCLALPSAVFAVGFLKWYIGIPLALLLAVAYWFSVRDMKAEEDQSLRFSIPSLLILIGVATFWCYLGGLGNLYSQSDDWCARNAIFRDLIRFEWPVIYQNKNAGLVYYIGYWLPSALIGRGVYLVTDSVRVAFFVGNIALWLWSVVCVTVVWLLLLVYLKANKRPRMWLVVLIFIFFSGLDIVGTLYNTLFKHWRFPIHIEWWTSYQFSSMTTALNWVFNQSIFAWLATVCFLFEKRVRNYAFIIVCLLSSAPLPAVGLAIYMVGYAVYYLVGAIRKKEAGGFWRDVFTVQNILPVLTFLPVYFLYYMSNLAVNVGQMHTVVLPRDWWGIAIVGTLTLAAVILAWVFREKKLLTARPKVWITIIVFLALTVVMMLLRPTVRIQYFLFLLMEAGVFLFLVWQDHENDLLFYLTWIAAFLCPLITVGTAGDFCMRASIPVVFVMMVMCIRYLFDHGASLGEKGFSVQKLLCILLIIALVLGAVTPIVEFWRGVRDFAQGKRAFDWIYTMERIFTGEKVGTDRNFIANDYKSHFFFRYLAK